MHLTSSRAFVRLSIVGFAATVALAFSPHSIAAVGTASIWSEIQLTPKTLNEQTLGFEIECEDRGGLKEFAVSITPKRHKISPVVTLRVRLMDGDSEVAVVPAEERRESGKITCWFRISSRLLPNTRFEFGEHGYGVQRSGEKPLVDEWGRQQYVGLPGGIGYWFKVSDFVDRGR